MQIPPKLREYLAGRECVAFVGAGFSAPCGMPGWGALFAALLKTTRDFLHDGDSVKRDLLDLCEAEASRGNFLAASIGIRRILDEQELSRALTKQFSHDRLRELSKKERARMDARLENLVCAPWSGIITTNYDTLIEHAFNVYGTTPMRADGQAPGLGDVLCMPHGAANFFVKLHGDTWSSGRVLCTDDYIRAWQSSPRIRHFLTATMLRYHVVFIGSSVEDEVLRLRQSLWADFSRRLPRSYALLPDTPQNRLRQEILNDEAGIETILYGVNADGGPHMAVDLFLEEARKCSGLQRAESLDGTLASLGRLAVMERLAHVGDINLSLMRVVRAQANHRLEEKWIYDPLWNSLNLGAEGPRLRGCTAGERIYRFMFLVSTSLLQYVSMGKRSYYEVPESIAAKLAPP